MGKSDELMRTHCLNCGAPVNGPFCGQCGQRIRNNSDRSLNRLLGELSDTFLILDNRFFLSVWYLFRFPGRMTVEYLEGKRRKFISPVTLFLFFNLIYFLVSPLTDYSLSLNDQINSQFYSTLTKDLVEVKLQKEGLDMETYSSIYQNMSDNISKSIMIINTPMIAVFVFLMAFKKRRFYFDSLIFALHFFSVFIFCWAMLDLVALLVDLFSLDRNSMIVFILFNLFTLLIPLTYSIIGIKKFLNIRWYWALPAGIGVIFGILLANLIYRFIIFLLTFWFT